MKLLFVVLFFVISGCLPDSTPSVTQPESFLLSWQNDPATTMTIDWYPDYETVTYLEYRKKGESEWSLEQGDVISIPGSNRYLQRSELTSLQPDQMYEFRFTGEDPAYLFRTMPDELNRPIHFVAGGDLMHHRDWMRHTAASVMRVAGEDLDFAILGGDLAYADGEARKLERWFHYLEVWAEEMITENRRVIPHITAIGNHEVRQAFIHNYPAAEYTRVDFRSTEAPYFTTFIPFPGERGYGVLDFGEYLSIFLLDTNHLNFVDGEQAEWLQYEMNNRQHVRHTIPVYHVAGYPSVRGFDGKVESSIRNHWVPLFEEFGVRLAFEHNDHAYKRTHPIRENQIDETGIHYIGDGAWGVRTRQPRVDEEGNLPWYIAEADSVRHFILVEMDGDRFQLEMYDEDAHPLDHLSIDTGVLP